MAATRVSSLLQLAALMANLPLSASEYWESGFGGYGQAFNERVGPYDANSTRFIDAINISNATGVFKIPGYDVSKPYPGTLIDGWTLRLALLDFSREGYVGRYYHENGTLDYETGDAMVGHSMQIQAPDALLQTAEDGTKVVNTDPSWGMCMWSFGAPGPSRKERYNNPSNKPLAEDGSCKGFLSDECIAALEKATQYAFAIPDDTYKYKGQFGSPVTCQSISTPDECGEYGPGNAGGSVPSYGGVPIRYLNGSVTESDGWEFISDKGTLFNSTADLQGFWDSLVVNYWVVLTAMVNATLDPEVAGYEKAPPMSRVHCVAANGMGTGKGFTFSGVVSANAQDSAGGGGSGSTGGTNGGGDDSGAGVMSPVGWVVGASLVLTVVLGAWA
jgi:hypothetical protein